MSQRSGLASILLENSYLKKYGVRVLNIAVGPSATPVGQRRSSEDVGGLHLGAVSNSSASNTSYSVSGNSILVLRSPTDHFKLLFTRRRLYCPTKAGRIIRGFFTIFSHISLPYTVHTQISGGLIGGFSAQL